MHQGLSLANIISMEILNLEVIYLNRTFKQLMLNLLYYYIITVEKLQLVTCTKLYSRSPPFDRRVERMFIRADNLLSVYFDVYKLTRFIDKCSDYFFKPGFPGFRVGCPYHIPDLDRFNSNMSGSRRYLSAFYKTNAD